MNFEIPADVRGQTPPTQLPPELNLILRNIILL